MSEEKLHMRLTFDSFYDEWKEKLYLRRSRFRQRSKQMKKPSKKARIKEILDRANRKFAGRWMASEDMSYIFPIAEVVYTGKPGDAIPSDPEELPLAIQIRTFISDVDNVAWDIESPVEVGQNTRFYENPYAVESGRYGFCIKFISRAEARKFAGKLRKRLADTLDKLEDTLDKLDRVGP